MKKMNEDYLWDKSGADAEIERLENALQAFRYQEHAPPALPAKIVEFEKKQSRRGFFRLSLAFASFAAILVVCLGVFWLQFPDKQPETESESAKIVNQPTFENQAREISIEKAADLRNEKSIAPIETSAPKAVKIKKLVSPSEATTRLTEIVKTQSLTARNDEAKNAKPKLTKEEKYAYDQLMLALSITSSKLKLVKDRVENAQAKNVSEKAR